MQVRKAFTANVSKGHTLVVADYGQLELRILAHLANCTSMITAFELGGDFHSRTALGMYDHIKEAIDKGVQKIPKLFSMLKNCVDVIFGHVLLAHVCSHQTKPKVVKL